MGLVYLVFLDDGHGGLTPGKRTPYLASLGRQIKENEFNKPVVNFIASDLKRHGVEVVLVAPTDDDTPLKARTDYANKIYWQYCSKYGTANVKCVYVSVHYNALDGKFDGNDPSGFSVHIYPGHRNKDAGRLAQCISNELAKGTPQKNRGIVEQDLHVVRETAMPAVLTENGFMDNKAEAELMLNVNFQKEVSTEHTTGILKYFGLVYKAPVVTPPAQPKPVAPASSGKVLHRVKVDGKQVGAYGDTKNILDAVENNLGATQIVIERVVK